jgi:hypothetical protein
MDNATSRTFLYDFGRARLLVACAAAGIEPVIRYSGDTTQEGQQALPSDRFCARLSRTIVDQRQDGMRNGVLERRFLTNGLFYIQLFSPITDTQAQLRLDLVSENLLTDLRTHQGKECDFTTAEITDSVANEPAWLRANVVSNYQFRQYIS